MTDDSNILPSKQPTPFPPPGPAGDPEVLKPLKMLLGMLPVASVADLADDARKHYGYLQSIHYHDFHGYLHHHWIELSPLFDDLSIRPDAEFLRRFIPLSEKFSYERVFEIRSSLKSEFSNEFQNWALPKHFTREWLFDLLLLSAATTYWIDDDLAEIQGRLLAEFLTALRSLQLSHGEKYVVWQYVAWLHAREKRVPKGIEELAALIQPFDCFTPLPGDVWADHALVELQRFPDTARRKWHLLLSHAASASSPKPSAKWMKSAQQLIAAIGRDQFLLTIKQWLEKEPEGTSQPILVRCLVTPWDTAVQRVNSQCVRGLVWMLGDAAASDSHLPRTLAQVALGAFKKVPGKGPRAPKVGNAAIYSLSQIRSLEAVGQLAMLKVRIKGGSVQKEIEKAFNVAATALNVSREEIEEIAVPTYELEPGGTREVNFGEHVARIQITGSTAALSWSDAKGKTLKSVPARVKQEHKDELKDLQQSVKDIQGMLPAQKDRIDNLFLAQKSWPLTVWKERYLDHPLVGAIAQRLIWMVDRVPTLFVNDVAQSVTGEALEFGRTAEVSLWHPVDRLVAEVLAWRDRLSDLRITQPFKQAHREVYLLTEAELRTNTYSNRFAAHVIRQHQFQALCAARGWKNRLRLMVDDSYEPPTKWLPQWGLRAEFWVEGIGGDYGTDTNESGVFLRLATDQVRFYREDAAQNSAHAGGGGYGQNWQRGPAEALPLEQIPPLVFSEIMRDVDLFVGVASVGNDPTWNDGGPDGRFRDYWQSYSFGDLSGSASTRKQVLEKLVPRLKIASVCSFSDKFLVVRGKRRTYKIHLGSGNILMEPNDQYLCIVPDSRTRANQGDLHLPFEGDQTLSIILSKALLLAADDKITDVTITRQIG